MPCRNRSIGPPLLPKSRSDWIYPRKDKKNHRIGSPEVAPSCPRPTVDAGPHPAALVFGPRHRSGHWASLCRSALNTPRWRQAVERRQRLNFKLILLPSGRTSLVLLSSPEGGGWGPASPRRSRRMRRLALAPGDSAAACVTSLFSE